MYFFSMSLVVTYLLISDSLSCCDILLIVSSTAALSDAACFNLITVNNNNDGSYTWEKYWVLIGQYSHICIVQQLDYCYI